MAVGQVCHTGLRCPGRAPGEDGEALMATVVGWGWEGVVAKQRRDTYRVSSGAATG